jgi:hypothetical protein
MRKVGLESGCHRGIIAAEPEKRKANMARQAAMAPQRPIVTPARA